MGQVLKVNGRDLSTYIRNAHGDGLEPASADAIDPQFTGSTAIGEGQTFVGNSLGNVAMSFPLILKAASTDALYKLIRDIRSDLVKGNTLEYSSGGATASTFFDMESGKLEPDFEFFLDQRGLCRATLTIWRRPYGHTGTSRVIASAVGTGPMTVTATGVLGDVDAQANLRLRAAGASGQGVQFGPMVYGVKYPVPSGFSPNAIGATAIATGALFNTATTVTASSLASGRVDGKYVALPRYPVGGFAAAGSPILFAGFTVSLAPDTYQGRYRMIGNVRFNGTPAASPLPNLYLDRIIYTGATSNDKSQLVATTSWQLADLGEILVSPVATTKITIQPGITQTGSATSFVATWPLNIDGIRLIPLDGDRAGIRAAGDSNFTGASSILDAWGIGKEVSYRLTLAASPIVDFGAAALRGNWPALPPVGSPAASGAAMLVIDPISYAATSGEPLGNRENRVIVEVRERFSYMR